MYIYIYIYIYIHSGRADSKDTEGSMKRAVPPAITNSSSSSSSSSSNNNNDNREFTKGGLVKGGLAIRHVFNLRIKNGT